LWPRRATGGRGRGRGRHVVGFGPGASVSAYRYRAARADGAIVAGTLDARDAGVATATLTERGLFPLRLAPADVDELARRPAPRRDLAIAFRSIAALVTAGLPLDKAVRASVPLTRGPLRDALEQALGALHEGASFGQALGAGHGVV